MERQSIKDEFYENDKLIHQIKEHQKTWEYRIQQRNDGKCTEKNLDYLWGKRLKLQSRYNKLESRQVLEYKLVQQRNGMELNENIRTRLEIIQKVLQRESFIENKYDDEYQPHIQRVRQIMDKLFNKRNRI